VTHLNESLLPLVLKRSPRVPEELWGHLEAGCEQCEASLAGFLGADGVDGLVDQLLLSSSSASVAVARDDLA